MFQNAIIVANFIILLFQRERQGHHQCRKFIDNISFTSPLMSMYLLINENNHYYNSLKFN